MLGWFEIIVVGVDFVCLVVVWWFGDLLGCVGGVGLSRSVLIWVGVY